MESDLRETPQKRTLPRDSNFASMDEAGKILGMGWLTRLFDTDGFPARWQCGIGWSEEPIWGWLHILSDVLIFLSYTAIPFVLAYYLRKRPETPFPYILILFVAFIRSHTSRLLSSFEDVRGSKSHS